MLLLRYLANQLQTHERQCIMSYTTVEDALQTVIAKISGYTADTNVMKGDYRALGTGQNLVVVLTPGPAQHSLVTSPRRVSSSWVIDIELFIGFKDEISTIAADIRTERQKIIDEIDKYPTLDSTANVVNAVIESLDEPTMWKLGGRQSMRNYWTQSMRCRVDERTNITIAE